MSQMIGTETTAQAGTQPRGKIIAYWSVTLLLATAVTLSGIGQLMQYGGNVGAAMSHAFANDYGDSGFNLILPLSYAALNIASWALRPKSRRF